ncbi:hypothetical protein N0V93_001982 [Gnomoniopsis smithogilvyi]|uniref:PX-associated-domain-containing protein n=1 Tax=Gnomoniopsis smithogilvyi TaxID=1191159 RepID=A0A9W8Z2P7_9PEZI|nr:hypothetical protein N0V93_001982 [Gnomoniopsis smithogilvyi]
MVSEAPQALTPTQLRALFDILNHTETYREAENFKHDNAIREYGYPFSAAETLQPTDVPSYKSKSASPLLQLILTKCILTIPATSTLPPDFWPFHFQGIMVKLAEADLSESYDKGTMGTRKTLATGASVIHEAVTRGLLSGVPKGTERIDLRKAQYDTTQASELARAWNECIHELVHGDLADEMFDHCAGTADFEGHSPAVAAATDYAIIHIATLLHHIFVGSPEGQYLLKLIENVYKLIPFVVIRQTLRMNAATMMNGMIRVFLAKMGVGAITNWFGMTTGADDGMNLMQRIISLVLSWDASEFRKKAAQIESAKDRPTREHFAALKTYTTMPRDAQEALREISINESKSIVAVIFDTTDPELTASLSATQHTQCLEWLSAQLSARDRDEITKVLCKSQPDRLTAAVRSAVGTYEPLIRALHESMDLREHVTSLEKFIGDFIETSKPKKVNGKSSSKISSKTKSPDSRPPSVEEYVALLRRNKGFLFEYCHQFAAKCTGLREMFQQWAHVVLDEFKQPRENADGAGAIDSDLQGLYEQLPADEQKEVLTSLDAHTKYLSQLGVLSQQRMQRVLDQLQQESAEDEKPSTTGKSSSKSSSSSSSPRSSSYGGPSMSGPGVYLMRWESLLDDTLITPASACGSLRYGRDVKGQKAQGKTVSEGVKGEWDANVIASQEDRTVPTAPDVRGIMTLLGEGFRGLVNAKVGEVGPTTSDKVDVLMNSKQGEELRNEMEGMTIAQ